MSLSIITINRNNAAGLEKTMQSVLSQSLDSVEYIIVDGASKDGSVDVIRKYAKAFGSRLKWVSESDKGIYNAMNKGIGMASGTYLQILNSGDTLVSSEVTQKMLNALEKNGNPSILYGNMLKDLPEGKIIRDKGFIGKDLTFLDFYIGTLNHSSAYIKKDLFNKYGLYDESLRIVSDWKWFMLAIVFGGEKPVYVDIDVSLFDMTGISETNKGLIARERNHVLEQVLPSAVLSDYEKWAPSIRKMMRIERHPWAKKMIWLLDRCLFKLEKF